VQFVEDAESMKLQNVAVNMWAMRAFDVQTATDLGGTILSTLAEHRPSGIIQGTLTNQTAYGLTGCSLYLNGSWTPLGDLAPGASRQVSRVSSGLMNPSSSPYGAQGMAWTQMPQMAVPTDPQQAGVRVRMQAALTDFVSSLGGNFTGSSSFFGGNYTPPRFFQPQVGEAILTGWCDDPRLAGAPIRVDGHPVTLNAVTLVVVHIPLR
jgi:hypothetical protein